MPSVAVVVCTRNRRDRLARLLAALDAQTVTDFELVVVDDASTDATPALLTEARVTHVREPQRAGPSVARDDGWRATSAPLVAFTDDDCEPEPGWLAALLTAHAADPATVLQGATLPSAREKDQEGPLSRTQSVAQLGPFFQCCNIAYPRSVLERVDGFAHDWDWGGEDTDLAYRARASGAAFVFVPGARVEHAIVALSPAAFVRSAGRFEDAMRLLHDHPGLREKVLWRGVFWKPSHLYVLLVLAAAALARRHPLLAALLAVPYLRDLRPRLWGRAALAPVILAHDVVETATTIRGGIRHRTTVI